MGKQGPCYHCGVTSTPLWRNGPPEKPVLCNACGSRWRTKGTLANYTPLHSRADPNDYEDNRVSRVKSISINKNKGLKLIKRKPNHDNEVVAPPDYNQGYRNTLDEDISNRSSSGSAISNSESCVQFGSADASELTGSGQSIVWDTVVPSKKRTCINCPKPSPVEKLTKDLYTILHEQQSSCFSESSENDLLFESETPMVSVEIGHGSVLIRHPSSIARDEESEASSLSVENKQYPTNEAYSHSIRHHLHYKNKSMNRACPMIEEEENIIGQGVQQEQLNRDRYRLEKVHVLGNHNSLLCNVDLNDVLNFEEFARCLTNEEQQQLQQYLPLLDIAELPDSLKSMFESPQFKEDISCYQQLLAEGIFDLSFLGDNAEDCKTLKGLALSHFAKAKWVEHYHRLKTCKNDTVKSSAARGPNGPTPSNLSGVKRSRDHPSQKFPETRTVKSPKRIVMNATYENKDLIDNDGSCFSPRSLFVMPPDGSSLMLDSLPSVDESSEQDLLLDVPSNGSFPQAELLHPAVNFGQQPSTSSSSTYPHLVHP